MDGSVSETLENNPNFMNEEYARKRVSESPLRVLETHVPMIENIKVSVSDRGELKGT